MKSLTRHLNESLNKADSKIRGYNKYLIEKNQPEWYKEIKNKLSKLKVTGFVGYSDYDAIFDALIENADFPKPKEISMSIFRDVLESSEFPKLIKRYWEEHIDIDKIPNEVVCGMMDESIKSNSKKIISKLNRNGSLFSGWFLFPEEFVKNVSCGPHHLQPETVAVVAYKAAGLFTGYEFENKKDLYNFVTNDFAELALGKKLMKKYKSKISHDTGYDTKKHSDNYYHKYL